LGSALKTLKYSEQVEEKRRDQEQNQKIHLGGAKKIAPERKLSPRTPSIPPAE